MKKFLVALFAIFLSFTISAAEVKLTADNTVVLRESFNPNSVTSLKQELLRLNANLKSGYPIYLVLYTPGGSIQKGLELFEFVKGLNRPVHTVTVFAASMGFQTVQSLGKRYILKYGVLMSHKARGGFSGEFGGGLSQLDSRYNMWLKRIDMLDQTTVARTNGKQTLKSYRAAYDNELWLNGPEAVKKGYADEVATVVCDSTLTSQKIEKVFDFGFFRARLLFSGCPMITSPLGIVGELLTNKGYMTVKEFLAANGKFGEKCNEKGVKPRKDYYGNIIKGKKAQLCAYDKKLTFDKVTKALEKKNEFLNRDLRNHVEYSY
jgi:ATP-dependent Clp protease, protease subunit